EVEEQITELKLELEDIEQSLVGVQEELEEDNEQLNIVIDEIAEMKETLQTIEEESYNVDACIAEVKEEFTEVDDFEGIPTEKVDEIVTTYTDTIEPTLRSEIENGRNTLVEARDLITE